MEKAKRYIATIGKLSELTRPLMRQPRLFQPRQKEQLEEKLLR